MISEDPGFPRTLKKKNGVDVKSKKRTGEEFQSTRIMISEDPGFRRTLKKKNGVDVKSKERTGEEFQSTAKKKLKVEEKLTDFDENLKCEFLSYQNIMEGMLLLGCIVEIRDSSLLCSLPGCLIGRIPISNISGKFYMLLNGSNASEHSNEQHILSSIFELGMVFPCKVMEIKVTESKKPSIILSINPQDINENMKTSDLYKKMVLYASVGSTEDYGYSMDLGIKGLSGFIPSTTEDIQNKLQIGQVIPVCVKQSPRETASVVQLQRLNFDEPFPEIHENSLKLSSIMPGANVNAFVTEVKHPFVFMKCLGFDACANLLSLDSNLKSLANGNEVSCRVLYVHPVTHIIYLHVGALPIPKTFHSFFGLKRFDFVQNILFLSSHLNKAYCKIRRKCFGFFMKKQLTAKNGISKGNLNLPCSIPKARVLHFHYIDNLVELTISKHWIDRKILHIEDVQVGNIFEGVVKTHLPYGMFVRICPNFTGYVKDIHMSDVRVTKPDKLFPIGAKVKCMVVALQSDRKPYLTCKESLIKLSNHEMLKSYEDAKSGLNYKGVVIKVLEDRVHVMFFQNVQGFLFSNSIPKDYVLFNGQTVNCRILTCDPDKRRMELSLQVEGSKLKEKIGEQHSEENNCNLSVPNKCSILDEEVPSRAVGEVPVSLKATITQVTGNQLNTLMHSDGAKGQVHITELGCAAEVAKKKVPKPALKSKGGSIKKPKELQPMKFSLNSSHPVEDSIPNTSDFVAKRKMLKPALKGKGGKEKKLQPKKSCVDSSHPVECGVMSASDFHDNRESYCGWGTMRVFQGSRGGYYGQSNYRGSTFRGDSGSGPRCVRSNIRRGRFLPGQWEHDMYSRSSQDHKSHDNRESYCGWGTMRVFQGSRGGYHGQSNYRGSTFRGDSGSGPRGVRSSIRRGLFLPGQWEHDMYSRSSQDHKSFAKKKVRKFALKHEKEKQKKLQPKKFRIDISASDFKSTTREHLRIKEDISWE